MSADQFPAPATLSPGEPVAATMARVYLNTGWTVFPAWWADQGVCACPDGAACPSPAKHPLTRRGVHDATDDRDRVAAWWDRWPHANIGLPAGNNGLAILDIDPRHGGMMSLARLDADLRAATGSGIPTTVTAATGSGGLHLFFTAPEGGIKSGSRVFGADMPGVDTRGRGGYVIAAPSVHACGGTYTWINFCGAMAPWPARWTAMIERPATPAPVPVRPTIAAGSGYATAALDSEVARVRAAAEGTRNDTLHLAAFRVGQLVGAGLLGEGCAAQELVAAGLATGLPMHEALATVRSGLHAGSARPRTESGDG